LGQFGEILDLIAEIKPRSPSDGAFPERDPWIVADGYRRGGAAMLSVLTEPSAFGGSLGILTKVSALGLPVMAKDFFVDDYQVYEARLAGADGVLIIARILEDRQLASMLDAVDELGMFALLEAFDEIDLHRLTTAASGRDRMLIGVNCRDLETLTVVPARHEELAGALPDSMVSVAESAIGTPADIERIAGLGYRSALVGSALMRSDDPAPLVRAMLDAGRRVAAVTT
jgi:indole-3-glycerol phosphate synthase